MTSAKHRAKQQATWRRQKAAQRARNPLGQQEKRRAYYAKNREQILNRQRRYYIDVWKLKDAGVIP